MKYVTEEQLRLVELDVRRTIAKFWIWVSIILIIGSGLLLAVSVG